MPANDRPEQLTIGPIVWDVPKQKAQISLTALMANGGGNYQLRVTATFAADAGTFPVTAEQAFVALSVNQQNIAQVEPLLVAWDRNNGTVVGAVDFAGTVRLTGPGGQTVDTKSFQTTISVS
jgi:hypothetical protein